jgi:hypothetical protein
MWWFAGFIIVLVVLMVVIRLRGRRSHLGTAWLRCHGAARCRAAIPLLANAIRHPNAIPTFWEQVELPLVEAIPDCAPSDKVALVAACEALAQATRNRDIARRIMAVRNSLC